MLTLHRPDLSGVLEDAYASFAALISARADLFGAAETPLGSAVPDRKRYLEFDATNQRGIPPALIALRDALCDAIRTEAVRLQDALLPGGEAALDALLDWGRGPMLRLTSYPTGEAGEVNQPHTDIDLFTMLPAATSPGLEVLLNGAWSPAVPAPSEILILPGDLLEPFGGPPGTAHRVVTDGEGRISASLFANAAPDLQLTNGARVSEILAERLRRVRRTHADLRDE